MMENLEMYPLVMTNIAIENGPFIDGLPNLKMVDLSMAMWNNQMVPKIDSNDTQVAIFFLAWGYLRSSQIQCKQTHKI